MNRKAQTIEFLLDIGKVKVISKFDIACTIFENIVK